MAAARAPDDIPEETCEEKGKEVDGARPVDVAGVEWALDEDNFDELDEGREDEDVVAAAVWTSVKVMLEVFFLPSLAVDVTRYTDVTSAPELPQKAACSCSQVFCAEGSFGC